MFRLPPEGHIPCFQSGEAINGNLAIRDCFLNGFNNFRRFCDCLCSENAVSIQNIVPLKVDGGSFGSSSLNPVDLAAIISEIV